MAISNRSKLEFAVVGVLLLLCAGFAVGLYKKRQDVEKGRQLISELASLRQAVSLFVTIHREGPPDLKTLASKSYQMDPVERPKPFLQNFKPAPNGEILDPFGHPYRYDPQTRWVISSSRGYESW